MLKSLRCAAGALVILLGVTACGGDDETPQEQPAPAKLAVTPGGAQTLGAGTGAVTLTASGASGTYQWALAPESGVGTLSATQGASVTFTPAAAVPATTTAVVTVTSGGETVALPMTVTPRAINGRVLAISEEPLPGLLVALSNGNGSFTTTTSDAQGRFSFPSGPATYDMVVRDSTGAFTVYRGLTRMDPVITPVTSSSSGASAQSASIAGTVTGGAFAPTQPALHTTVTAFASPDLALTSFAMDDTDAGGAYALSTGSLRWMDAATVTGTVHALQIEKNAAGLPVAYKGYGKLENQAVTNGAALTNRNVALTPVTAGTFSASFNLPAGGTLANRFVYLQFGPHALGALASVSGGAPALSLPVPQLPGATVTLLASFTTTHGEGQAIRSGLAPNATDVAFNVFDAPAVTAPAAAATNVTLQTPFAWTAVPSAVHWARFRPTATGPHVYVVTAGNQVTLPDLSGLGVDLPKSAAYEFQLYTFAPLANVDAMAVSGNFARHYYGGLAANTPSEFAFATGATRTFTTAP